MPEEDSSAQSEIAITVKGPSELKLSITILPSKSVLDLKQIIAEKSDVEKDRQRLIYSGKVLKDEDPISQYKILNGHTIHMVKGAVKPAAQASSTGSTSTGGIPRLPQMGTGLNVAGNPVDSVENVHHGLAGFNPFAGMQGMNNMYDPNAMASMMQNPDFLRNMSDMMSRPEVVDQIIAANPQLASMGPQIRQMMNNPMVRQMMSNPDTLRTMMQMQSAMGGQEGGMGGMAGLGNVGGFPNPYGRTGGATQDQGGANPPTEPFPNLFAPGTGTAAPSTTTATGDPTGGSANPNPATGTNAPLPNPLASLFGQGGANPFGGGPNPNPFAGAGGANPFAGGANPFAQAGGANPFGFDPAMLFGRGGPGGGGGGWNMPSSTQPRDTRPPEEIYATQLGQLNAMGLWDAQKNIRALRSTGGNVEAAIDLIFSGAMDGQGA